MSGTEQLDDLKTAEMREMMNQLLEQEKKMAELSKDQTAAPDPANSESTDNAKIANNLKKELKVDAIAKVVVTADHLQANLCVFEPQFDGAHITMEVLKDALKKENVKFGIDEELLENIVEERFYDKILVVAKGVPASHGDDGSITYHYEQVKKLVPKRLEDGSVDFRDLGLIVNILKGDTICTIVKETEGEAGTDVYGMPIVPKRGKPPVIPQGKNTLVNGDGTKLLATESGNLIYQQGRYMVETVFTINDDISTATGNIMFMGDVVVRGNVLEGFTVNAGKSIKVSGMVNGATLYSVEDIVVKNGVVASTITSETGNITIGFGENTRIKTKGNLTTSSLISCNTYVEGDLECTKNPGVIIAGNTTVLGKFVCNTIGHKNYINTTVSVGAITSLAIEKSDIEKQIEKINEDINKLNISLEFLQEKKRQGIKLDQSREDFISSAIRMKVQKTLEKKPLKARVLEIEQIISKNDDISIKANRSLYPNVRIFINNFTATTSVETGRTVIYSDKDGIVYK